MKTLNKNNKKRVWVMFAFVVIAFIFLVGRLVYIQLIKGGEYKLMAIEQRTRSVSISAKRGNICDTKGVKLAFSKQCYTVWVHKNSIENPYNTSQELSEILKMPVDEIMEKLTESKSNVIALKRWISKDIAELINNKRINGVGVAKDNMRVYPNNNFASHILGHTTIDGIGLAGLERMYENKLKGKEGVQVIDADASGKKLAYGKDKLYLPENGYNLVLTIDEIIQHFMEEALERGVEEYKAKRIMAIAIEPKTGGILAMATKPDYNPNSPRDISNFYPNLDAENISSEELVNLWNVMWRNPNVNEVYEPGSTFKLITTAIALEENIISLNTRFNTKGYVEIYGSKIKNWDYPATHSNFTIVEALEKSLNTTFIELAQGIGRKLFYNYLVSFGFNSKTGVDLPGESRAIIYSEENMGPVELATISFGHGIGVTPLQMATAINVISSDGKLLQPHIVRGYCDDEGNMIEEIKPKVMRDVISSKTAKDMRKLMELVVTEGSGKRAYIAGVRVGGKTGTSEKLVDGQYSQEYAYASFVAIAPVDNPKITLLVIVDEPEDIHYGSQTAAPIARDILDDTLRYMGIEPDISENQKTVKLPRLIGKTKYQADKILKALGLSYTMDPVYVEDDMSIILDQFPYPETLVTHQDIIILKVDSGD